MKSICKDLMLFITCIILFFFIGYITYDFLDKYEAKYTESMYVGLTSIVCYLFSKIKEPIYKQRMFVFVLISLFIIFVLKVHMKPLGDLTDFTISNFIIIVFILLFDFIEFIIKNRKKFFQKNIDKKNCLNKK